MPRRMKGRGLEDILLPAMAAIDTCMDCWRTPEPHFLEPLDFDAIREQREAWAEREIAAAAARRAAAEARLAAVAPREAEPVFEGPPAPAPRRHRPPPAGPSPRQRALAAEDAAEAAAIAAAIAANPIRSGINPLVVRRTTPGLVTYNPLSRNATRRFFGEL